jgi:hypothetical protein
VNINPPAYFEHLGISKSLVAPYAPKAQGSRAITCCTIVFAISIKSQRNHRESISHLFGLLAFFSI